MLNGKIFLLKLNGKGCMNDRDWQEVAMMRWSRPHRGLAIRRVTLTTHSARTTTSVRVASTTDLSTSTDIWSTVCPRMTSTSLTFSSQTLSLILVYTWNLSVYWNRL